MPNKRELDLSKKRTSGWFEAFVRNVDEKKHMKSTINKMLNSLYSDNFNLSIPALCLDMGCGDGTLSEYVASGLNNKNKTRYEAIDADPKFARKTQRKLEKLGLGGINVVQGDCFDKSGLDKLGTNAGVILASNIAYYAGDKIDFFVKEITQKLGKNGIAIFMHEDEMADPNYFRIKYNSPVCGASITGQISNALKNNGNHFHEFMSISQMLLPNLEDDHIYKELHKSSYDNDNLLNLPEINNTLIQAALLHVKEEINKGASIQDIFTLTVKEMAYKDLLEDTVANDLGNFPYLDKSLKFLHQLNTTKKLLEFVAQRPLEAIAEENSLSDYLLESRNLSSQHAGKIMLRSRYQIAISKEHDAQLTSQIIPSIITELQKDYADNIAKHDKILMARQQDTQKVA